MHNIGLNVNLNIVCFSFWRTTKYIMVNNKYMTHLNTHPICCLLSLKFYIFFVVFLLFFIVFLLFFIVYKCVFFLNENMYIIIIIIIISIVSFNDQDLSILAANCRIRKGVRISPLPASEWLQYSGGRHLPWSPRPWPGTPLVTTLSITSKRLLHEISVFLSLSCSRKH